MDGEEVKYELSITNTEGAYRVTQEFVFENVAPGTYTLVITKPAHTSFTIENFVVADEDINLALDNREAIKLMVLHSGDIDGDGQIDSRDLSKLIDNFGRFGENITEPLADLSGDGQVDSRDLTQLIDSFGRSRTIISW
jgi:hypothetical protein